MKNCLPLLLSTILFTATLAAGAEESLLQKDKAQTLTPEQARMLGPKSSGRHYDPRMLRALEIAKRRAKSKMTWHCWAFVKDALLAAEVVPSRPTSVWAKQAGAELSRDFGFKKLWTRDPYAAPVGAVIVYGGHDAGHVELRTEQGFVSDFVSRTAYPRPVVGIYVKRA
jgi:hypothetical protein